MDRDSSVGIPTRYGLYGPRIESQWVRDFSAPIQTGLGTHPASYKMSTWSFPGAKRPGRGVDHAPSSSAEVNPLTPNDPYRGRTAPLTSKRCILYIYSTNIGTEYFKHGVYSPFLSLQNAVCFIILTYLVPVLVIFCIQSVLKLKKKFRRQTVKERVELYPYSPYGTSWPVLG